MDYCLHGFNYRGVVARVGGLCKCRLIEGETKSDGQ